MNLAIIPARGGSKRIPRKNIKEFCGRPMIAYAISAALESRLFVDVVVSSDDDEIIEVARRLGAKVPFVRPRELADDHTATVPVISHAATTCRSLGMTFERVCCIYPAVPFIEVSDLREGLDLLSQSGADYAFPVTSFPSAVQRALARHDNGRMQPLYPQYELSRSQDLEPTYHDAGQFYWGHFSSWTSNPRIHSNAAGLVVPNWRVVDIDTPEDWSRAERLFAVLR
jgi:pseudaminic acid cytidylyltransferase